jgi:hypothetical protein
VPVACGLWRRKGPAGEDGRKAGGGAARGTGEGEGREGVWVTRVKVEESCMPVMLRGEG